ncbi:glycosyltransferase family 2 protein [Paenibacillus rhizovicinus]|uniref:Glycosyltransferase family 2 protein n=1 Tax=Paenibacillus rhizovicinus TaxID=2704463 RepID=A0A6C0P1W3_9BACL|nr:glycosyltransferase family 2 protein [Paenibacillus rhizovicinus]QHW32455.1 glycosyltransferase family 2 protein [Paenibacillus rhizovicinus]
MGTEPEETNGFGGNDHENSNENSNDSSGDGGGSEGGPLPVSLCMIVRNESRFLADCLRSAVPFVMEIIVVDTGSTDDTAVIAEAFGARVIHAAWKDDFAEARNGSLAAAAQPWILVLDADERLAVGDADAWRALLGDASKWGYFVKVNSRVGSGANGDTVTDAVCRLFRRDTRIRFRGLVHEETATAVCEAFGDAAIGYAEGLEIRHEGYRDEVIAERDKFARNRRLLERALAVSPEDPALRYAAGAELFASGEYSSALSWLEPLAQLERDPGYGSDLALKIIHACRAVGRLPDAERYAAMAARRYADFADVHEARCEVLLALDAPLPALWSAEAAMSAGPAPACYSTAAGAGTYRALGLAGAALERLYRYREAAETYGAAIAQRFDHAPSWQRLLLLGQLDASLRPLWLEAARSSAAASAPPFPWLEGQLLEWLCDLRQPDEAAAVWALAVGGAGGRSPGALAEGLWLVQRGEAQRGRQVWDAACEAGDADAARLAVYGFALALGEGDAERAHFMQERRVGSEYAAAARAALAACEGAAQAMPPDAAGSAIALALLRLGAVPAWLRLHAAAAPAAPASARAALRAVPPLLLAALLRTAPPAQLAALRAALAAGGAGLPRPRLRRTAWRPAGPRPPAANGGQRRRTSPPPERRARAHGSGAPPPQGSPPQARLWRAPRAPRARAETCPRCTAKRPCRSSSARPSSRLYKPRSSQALFSWRSEP